MAYSSLSDTVAFTEKTLSLEKFAAMTKLGQTTIQSMKISSFPEPLVEGLILKLEAGMLVDKIADDIYDAEYSYKVYVSPWQHFKKLYLPMWFIKKWPVKYEKRRGKVHVKLTRLATYPKANIAIPHDQRFYRFILGGEEHIHDKVEQI